MPSGQDVLRVLFLPSGASPPTEVQGILTPPEYRVDVATASTAGATLATDGRHHAIVMEVAPVEDVGANRVRDLRRQGIGTPILVLIPPDSCVDMVAVLDAGADDCLQTPFSPEEFRARLRSLTRRAEDRVPCVLRAGALELDAEEHCVTLDGQPVALSAKEFALLEYMMRNPNRMLTRSMISQSVWDSNYEAGSNVIDVYVSSLRRKVDRGRAARRIQTVIGSGYRFVPDPPAERVAGAQQGG